MVGPFGDLVRQMADAYGEGQSYHLTNLVMCPTDSPTPAAIQACGGRLEREIAELREENPALRIVALGSEAASFFLGKVRLSDVEGGWVQTERWGLVLPLSIMVARTVNAFPAFDLGMRKAFALDANVLEVPHLSYTVVRDIDELWDELEGPDIACDIETQVVSGEAITCMGFCDEGDGIFIVPQDLVYWQTDKLRLLFGDKRFRFGWHNGYNFDLPRIKQELGFWAPLHWDTILEHYALCETGLERGNLDVKDNASRGHGLKSLAKWYLDVDPAYGRQVSFDATDAISVRERHKYLAVDVWNTMNLHKIFHRMKMQEEARDAVT